MKKASYILIVVIVLFVGLFLIPDTNAASKGPNSNFNPTLNNPVDYGSGVYYFPYKGNKFGMALAYFLKTNPRKRITSVSGDGTSGHGSTAGYFVTTEDK